MKKSRGLNRDKFFCALVKLLGHEPLRFEMNVVAGQSFKTVLICLCEKKERLVGEAGDIM